MLPIGHSQQHKSRPPGNLSNPVPVAFRTGLSDKNRNIASYRSGSCALDIPQGLVAIAIKKLFHTPCVVTLHGSDAHGLKHPFFKRLNRMVAHQADACTANSAATRDAVSGLKTPLNIPIIPMESIPEFLIKNKRVQRHCDNPCIPMESSSVCGSACSDQGRGSTDTRHACCY